MISVSHNYVTHHTMNTKSLIGAAAIAVFSLTSNAASTNPVQVTGPSFADVELGSFTIANESNVTGSLGFAPYVLIAPGFKIALPNVSFNSVTAYSPTSALSTGTLAGYDFSFLNLSSGTYILRTSGSLNGTNFIAAQFNAFSVSPVPEPSTYAMVFAGLLSVLALRRRQKNQG